MRRACFIALRRLIDSPPTLTPFRAILEKDSKTSQKTRQISLERFFSPKLNLMRLAT
jgi:hypothetical protein